MYSEDLHVKNFRAYLSTTIPRLLFSQSSDSIFFSKDAPFVTFVVSHIPHLNSQNLLFFLKISFSPFSLTFVPTFNITHNLNPRTQNFDQMNVKFNHQ